MAIMEHLRMTQTPKPYAKCISKVLALSAEQLVRHAFGGYCTEAGQTMNPFVMFWGLIVQFRFNGDADIGHRYGYAIRALVNLAL